MEIEALEIAGFVSAFKALRLSYGLSPRSKVSSSMDVQGSKMHSDWDALPNDKDVTLLSTLVQRGDEHAKVCRGIVVWMKITAPVYFWAELETYRAGHERLMSESTMHIDCKGLTGEALQKAKAKIPMGKELTKIDFFSYQALRNVYRQRRHHRLPEWQRFCDWIEMLPFASKFITIGLDKE